MNYVDVSGLRIAYERAGSGPTLVLVHGYVGDGRSTFPRQLGDLSNEFDVVAFDLPGAGESADPPESFRMGDFADSLAGFMAAIEVRSAHILGLSFGGGLALEFYRRHPEIVDSLILVSAYAGWAGSLPTDELELRLRQALDLADLPPERLREELTSTMFSAAPAPDLVNDFGESIARFHRSGLRTMALALAEADLRDVLPQIAVPTLLVYGDADVRAPLAVAEAIHTSVPGSELVVIPGAGHLITLEAPARFNDEIRRFLRPISSA